MGRSKVFFRKGALEHLESLRLAERSSRAVVLQAVLRMYPRKMKYRRLKAGALRAQAEWRRVSERRRFLIARGQVIRAQVCMHGLRLGILSASCGYGVLVLSYDSSFGEVR